jgi:hypothetical protein
MARFAVSCPLDFAGAVGVVPRSGAPSIVSDVVGLQQSSTSTWTALTAAIATMETDVAALLATTAVQGDNTTKTSVTLGQTDLRTFEQDIAQGASLTSIKSTLDTLINTTWAANVVITGDTTANADLVLVTADWVAAKAAQVAFAAAVAAVPSTGDVVISVNVTNVKTVSGLRKQFMKVANFLGGNLNGLTP